MTTISRFMDRIYLLGAWLAGALLVLLCLLVLYSILARLVGWFAGGASDVAGYAMATSSFMALAYTFRSQGHIRVSILSQRLEGAKRRALEIWAHLVISGVASFLAFYMMRLVIDSYDYGERSEGADAILLWIPQTPVALGSILFALSTIHVLLIVLFDYKSIDPEQGEAGGPQEV
ncbi:TRAP-type C4-dicarboxylate transport system, small permease component [Cohaesibacter marisflavi]|uniref:TRAP transporter small permease protein n=1 Tax=Cohaesibacter marisflavi TaxID=655353 RepID=A0A1I5IRX7_9HYPH|nr:TRAP transporter small permease [Cohaesibacter marisflavi]SFO62911.1 TRAP-type C4-dicarboxylate transport system, small permease component [Cohaesibacter marisflavi]